ncbi:MAG: hypothetical protein JSU57_03560 [Candidatus Heimdallarchaeota archaeon]|nr:MAG: hypothetical protein JSU57_03560 [Candidatus Heimdallarchaeota archaeon]
MPSYRCQNCGKIVSPIPKHCDKEMVIGEVEGIPSLICAVGGDTCPHEPLPKCCSMPGYTRWI